MTIREQLKEKHIDTQKIDSIINEKAFFESVKSKNRNKITQFINRGIDVNAKDEYGWSALMYTTDTDDYKTARLLIDSGADINIQDEDGQTPLMNSAFVNAKKTAELLISHGAKVNIKDNNGQTALMLAALSNSKGIGKLLILNGADIGVKDNEELTPYSITINTWRSEVLLLFFDNYFLSKMVGDVVNIQFLKDVFVKKFGSNFNTYDLETYFDVYCKTKNDKTLRLLEDGVSIQVFPSNKEIIKSLKPFFEAKKDIEIKELQSFFEKKYHCQLEEKDLIKALDSFNSLNNNEIATIKKGYLFFINLLSDDFYSKNSFSDEHSFNFDGGYLLSKMGATWFVSYSYYKIIDKRHENWSLISTCGSRASVYDKTKKYHLFWLKQVLQMEENRLNTNKIGVSAVETKRMAKEILIKIISKPTFLPIPTSMEKEQQNSSSQKLTIEEEYKIGCEFYKDGLYENALKQFSNLAEEGYHLAQKSLADMYFKGEGTEKDLEKALEWYEKAAEQGNDSAQFSLGLFFFCGNGVTQDYAEAKKWFEKASAQNNSSASYFLSCMYYNGDGTEKDRQKAKWLFEKARETCNEQEIMELDKLYYEYRNKNTNLNIPVEAQNYELPKKKKIVIIKKKKVL